MSLNIKLRDNVKKDYIFCVLRNIDLTRGIWMLYLAYKGLSLMEIGIMESIYHLTSFLMEIPTGIVADLYGRKVSRILGRVFNVFSIILLLGNNIILYVLSFVLTAIGNNLESGAGQALVYDSLKEIGEEDRFMKISGKREIFFQIASSMGLILGGYLGTVDYKLVYILATVFAVMSVIQSFTFTEPSIGKPVIEGSIKEMFFDQFRKSIEIIKGDRRIPFLIISIELFDTFVVTEFFYIQNYFKLLGKSEFEIGAILAICGIIAAYMGAKAYKIESKYGFKGVLTFLPIIAIISFWGVVNRNLTIIAFITIMAVDSILIVVICDYINRLIPSEQRATILSFQSMAFSLFMIILFPIVGSLGDKYGLLGAFKMVAIVASVVLICIIKIVRDKWTDIKNY